MYQSDIKAFFHKIYFALYHIQPDCIDLKVYFIIPLNHLMLY